MNPDGPCCALLNLGLGVTGSRQGGSAASLDDEDIPGKWHAVKKAAGPAGIPLQDQDPPLQVEGDAPSRPDLVSMLVDVTDVAPRIRTRSIQLRRAYGGTTTLSNFWEAVDTFEVTCTELKIRVANTNNFDNQFGLEWTRLGLCEDLPGLVTNY